MNGKEERSKKFKERDRVKKEILLEKKLNTVNEHIKLCDNILKSNDTIKIAKKEIENNKNRYKEFPIDISFLPQKIEKEEEKREKLINRDFEISKLLQEEYNIKV